MKKPLIGGIEAGGTKFICAVGDGKKSIKAMAQFPTLQPETTLPQVVNFFRDQEQKMGLLAGISIASFGPLVVDPKSEHYGMILPTPKPGWSGTDFISPLKESFDIPVWIDTDVNIAAYGEWRWGAAENVDNLVYLTVGTGIGGGAIINGQIVRGLTHPEMGHMHIPQDLQLDPFEGVCIFHKNCLEGLACGFAIEKRWGKRAETLPSSHPAWQLEAHYLALALVNIICMLSPRLILLGGGVMSQKHLFAMIHTEVVSTLKQYIQSPFLSDQIDRYIMPPGLGTMSGILGAIAYGLDQISAHPV